MARKYNFWKNGVQKLGKMAYTGSLAGKNGTCGCDCGHYNDLGEYIIDCYAQKGNFNFPGVKKGLSKMAVGLKTELDKVFADFEDQWNRMRKKPTMFRIHHSGDFVSVEHWYMWVDFANRHPECKFYTYTKRYDFVRAFFADGWELPENFTLNISIWESDGIAQWNEFRHHSGVNCFIVDYINGKPYEKLDGQKNVRCHAYLDNGKKNKDGGDHTCANCCNGNPLCMQHRKGGDGLAIHCAKHN